MAKTYYAPTHEYIEVDGNTGYVGITDYARKALGNIVYVDMPEQGDDITAGEDFGAIESVKAASELVAPVSGAVLDINEVLLDNPALLNKENPNTWIIKVELTDPSELDALLDEEAYAAHCEAEGAH